MERVLLSNKAKQAPSLPPHHPICRSAVFRPPTAMDDESSDILGQQTKPALRSSKSSGGNAWLGASLTIQLILGFLALLSLYVVFMRIWFRILLWKERSYKLCAFFLQGESSLLTYSLFQCNASETRYS